MTSARWCLPTDPGGYQKIVDTARAAKEPLHCWEERLYGVDHALIGVTLLESWKIDGDISTAVLHHHDCRDFDAPYGLTARMSIADFLSVKADLGCVDDVNPPPPGAFRWFNCEAEESVQALAGQIREAFEAEVALFRPASSPR